jgi:hypothetical protein
MEQPEEGEDGHQKPPCASSRQFISMRHFIFNANDLKIISREALHSNPAVSD